MLLFYNLAKKKLVFREFFPQESLVALILIPQEETKTKIKFLWKIFCINAKES